MWNMKMRLLNRCTMHTRIDFVVRVGKSQGLHILQKCVMDVGQNEDHLALAPRKCLHVGRHNYGLKIDC